MSTNLALASIKSTGSTTTRTLGARAADIVNVRDYGAVGDGSTDDTDAIRAAFAAAFGPLNSPNGQGNPFINKEVFIPAGNYVITSPIYLTNILGGKVYGAGNGSSQLLFNGTVGTAGAGNTTLDYYPNLRPMFILDGVAYTSFSDFDIAGNHTVVQPRVETTTTQATTAASGHNTITVADASDVQVNMQVYNRNAPDSIVAYVISKSTNTLTLSADVASPGVGNGDTIYFVSPISGFHMHQTGPNGATSGNIFSRMNISDFGIGIFAGDSETFGANCENISLYDIQFNRCSYAGFRVFGQNTLNCQVVGGGASECGTVATFISNSKQGNGSAAYSVTTGGIMLLQNLSNSGGAPTSTNTGVDIYQAGTQPMKIYGGRSESLHAIIAIEGGSPANFENWNWGCTSTASIPASLIDTSFGGVVHLDGCSLGPNVSSGNPVLCALGNAGTLSLHNVMFNSNGDQLKITGATDNAQFSQTGKWNSVATPTPATLFGSFTGKVLEYSPFTRVTVSDLPTANAKYAGLRASVTDANATTFYSTVAGTGSNIVPVWCNGTNWVIA